MNGSWSGGIDGNTGDIMTEWVENRIDEIQGKIKSLKKEKKKLQKELESTKRRLKEVYI